MGISNRFASAASNNTFIFNTIYVFSVLSFHALCPRQSCLTNYFVFLSHVNRVIAKPINVYSAPTLPQNPKKLSLINSSISSIIPSLFPPSFPFASVPSSTSWLQFQAPPTAPPVYVLPVAPVLPHLSHLSYSPPLPSSPGFLASSFFFTSEFPLSKSVSFSFSTLPPPLPCPLTSCLSPPASPLPPGVPSHFKRDYSVPELYI